MAGSSHKWTHFSDLQDPYAGWVDAELPALRRVWLEQKANLEDSGLVSEFNRRLIREYAIEGGIIERAYTLDRGVTQVLIDRGIDASLIPHGATNKDPQHVAAIIRAHQDVVEGLFDMVKGGRPLTTGAIKEMHSVLMQHEKTTVAVDTLGRLVDVPLIKGAYKTLPNNPMRPDGSIHEYCPPEHVAAEMDRLIAAHDRHEVAGVATEVEAAWLHHAFTQIHPFQDGNGRIARLISSYVFVKDNNFPLTLVDAQDRDTYIAALEAADRGDLRALIALFCKVERRAFIKILGVASSVPEHGEIDKIIDAARQTISSRAQAQTERIESAKQTARTLHGLAILSLQSVAEKLRAELGPLSSAYGFQVDSESNTGHQRHLYRGQVAEVARRLDYVANINVYHEWCRLILNTESHSEFLVSFHGIGFAFRGVLAASVGIYSRVDTGAGQETTEAINACESVFQMNYLEDPSATAARFERWLKDSIARALEMWRSTL